MIPTLGITAFSGTGKTTLLKHLIPLLRAQGIRPGLIKHTHHDMDVDIPGKDSYELRKAGAYQTLVASSQRWALMTETPGNQTVSLPYLVSKMDRSAVDIVLVEGFKNEGIDKILLFRQQAGHHSSELIIDSSVIAIATDILLPCDLPQLPLNSPEIIGTFIIKWLAKQRG